MSFLWGSSYLWSALLEKTTNSTVNASQIEKTTTTPTFQPPHLRDLPPNQDKENGENDGHLPGFPKPQPLYLEDHPKVVRIHPPILATPGHFC